MSVSVRVGMVGLLALAVPVPMLGCGGPDSGGDRTPTMDSGTGGTGADNPDAGDTATCAAAGCHANATCDATGGTAVCTCSAGYAGDGKACDDVDECADGSHDCSADATCANSDGSFSCACKAGFTGDGKTCADFNECKTAQNTCDPNAKCTNATGGFDCACGAGTDGDGFGCADVDECAKASLFECGNNASCENTFGSYDCACDALFVGDGKTCDDACDVALTDTDLCDPNGVCRITNLKAVCDACEPGFLADGTIGDGTKQNCTAEVSNECPDACDGASGDDVAHAVCTGLPLARTCACAPGYSPDMDPPTTCTQIDECDAGTDNCDSHSTCVDSPGGFVCDCKDGYTKDPSGKCVNLNECAEDPGPCHPNAACTDKNPGFSCKCKPGYEGDGSVCRDINECEKGTADCPASATCVNTAGSFECTDLDECAMNLDDCDAKNATCTNEDPGYACDCKSGYLGDGKTCACDLSGYWAMRQDVTVTWPEQVAPGTSTVTINCGCMKTTVWELHRYDYDGKKIKVSKKGCGQERAPDLVSPYFLTSETPAAETYSVYVPMSVYDPIALQKGVSLPVVGALPGKKFTTPTEAAVVGIKLDDPLNDPWPASRADVHAVVGASPAWDDIEDDGQPGLSLWPQPTKNVKTLAAVQMGTSQTYSYLPVDFGIDMSANLVITQRAACVSGATRVKTHLEAEIETCSRITGDVVNEGAESRFHSCTVVAAARAPDDPAPSAWNTNVLKAVCEAADWTSGTACNDAQINFLDMQDQSAASGATFELVRIADLSDDEPSCGDVRTELPALGVRECSNACDDN